MLESGFPWPDEYAALLPAIREAWGIESEIYLTRRLSGKSGAQVFAADVSSQRFRGLAILKLGPSPDPSWQEMSEADRHALAFESAPEFAAAHLPTLLGWHQEGDSLAILSSVAGRGLEYAVPWHTCSYEHQLEIIRRVSGEILEDWNRDYRLAAGMHQPQGLLEGWLGYRLDPDEGRIQGFLQNECRLSPTEPTINYEGHWYPNPLAFATRAVSLPDTVHIRAAKGFQHGDFHGFNLLVGSTPSSRSDYFLIDLANYENDQFLFLDHALFELNLLLAKRESADSLHWDSLLHHLRSFRHHDDTVELRGDDVGLIDLVRALRRSLLDWVDRHESHRLSYMEAQYSLARVAAGLNFCNKPIDPRDRRKAFLYAASNLKDYLKVHNVEWPKHGPPFRIDGDVSSTSGAAPATDGARASGDGRPDPELPEKPAVAVLAFENLSNDPDQEFFADGISLEILTALSRIDWLMVISRGSTFTYKKQARDPVQVARELGVHYVVEGDVRKSGERVRVSVRLVDGRSGRTLWVERYDRALADIFELQDEIAESIAGNIDGRLKVSERESAHRRHGNLNVWESFQRGLWHLFRFSDQDHGIARQEMTSLTKMVPGFALPYAVLAFLDTREILFGYTENRDALLEEARGRATRAVDLDDTSSLAHLVLGRVYMLASEHEEAISESEIAIALNPSSSQAYGSLALALLCSGRAEEAIAPLDTSIRLSPKGPDLALKILGKAWLDYHLGKLSDAEQVLRSVPSQVDAQGWRLLVGAALKVRQDRLDEARALVEEVTRVRPDLTSSDIAHAWQHMHAKYLATFLGDLEKAGLPHD